ncbi:hypothetical protein A1O7_05035 [Cladophialophora yegresii CBS 114405]|uniref:Uncharacterized protein n=1 Tax=Cladophialophora yegresii CBS 114405 TaxID=1182544 RepID=W9VYJ9_9EURO|nr:uncharacterized protein A1O7_05035 [Cladophialophora yegresii CBS 114405]EXJ60882.1 hypothetical protein A1O7_05035 [Cladophialophora yegresii CBS 114405]
MAPLNLNTVLRPPHVTFDLPGPYHRHSLRSVLDFFTTADRDNVFSHNSHSGKQHRQHSHNQLSGHARVRPLIFDSAHVIFPSFAVRETTQAYFLEGEFPGNHDPSDIRIGRLGSQGILVEARSTEEVDLAWEGGGSFFEGLAPLSSEFPTHEGKERRLEEGRITKGKEKKYGHRKDSTSTPTDGSFGPASTQSIICTALAEPFLNRLTGRDAARDETTSTSRLHSPDEHLSVSPYSLKGIPAAFSAVSHFSDRLTVTAQKLV